MEQKVELGKAYRETTHGIIGIATARTEHLTGSSRVFLEWRDGNTVRGQWLDEGRLEEVRDPR